MCKRHPFLAFKKEKRDNIPIVPPLHVSVSFHYFVKHLEIISSIDKSHYYEPIRALFQSCFYQGLIYASPKASRIFLEKFNDLLLRFIG